MEENETNERKKLWTKNFTDFTPEDWTNFMNDVSTQIYEIETQMLNDKTNVNYR